MNTKAKKVEGSEDIGEASAAAGEVNAAKATRPKTTADVIYHPDDGDPVRVKWGGLEFKAYVAVRVPLTHSISVPLKKEHVLADGTVQTRNIETKVSLVELARGNPSFSVDGVRASKKIAAERVPTDSDEYRSYCISWIASSTDAHTMDVRWDAEDALREQCGVDGRDIAYLRPFFEATRGKLAGEITEHVAKFAA
jgi:hypothetical protein